MKIVYAFDVDGTLTPSRLKMDPNFQEFFINFCKYNYVYLVTGSDKDKTIEQVGEEVWHAAAGCLQSCGNHIFVKGEEVYRNNWEPNEDLIELLESFLKISKWITQTSNHIERRIGLVSEHFTKQNVIDRLSGNTAIGHVRYSTTGGTVLRNVQPLFADLTVGGFAIAHNGNLTNGLTLRHELKKEGEN